MKNTFFTLLLISIALSSCTETPAVAPIEKPKVGEIIDVEDPFEGKSLEATELLLLKELDICGDPNDSLCVPCDPKYFTFSKFRSDKKLKDAFMLQIRGTTRLKGEASIFPVRRIMIFERENGQLVKTNGFVGELVALEQSENAVQRLLLAFYDTKEDVIFHCVFHWKDKKFAFKEVKAIDIGPGPRGITKDQQTIVNKEVFQILKDKKMLF